MNGPFSVPDHCNGAYVGLAAMRFLAGNHNEDATCVPSINITEKNGGSLEVDFLMWVRERRYWLREEVYLIAGECKTYAHFEPRDVRRMQVIARKFPGVVLVFATFRDKLDPQEKRSIQRLAQWERGLRPPEGWRAPIIILTAKELFSFDGAPQCWSDDSTLKDKVERFDHGKTIEATADLTQQLYLGMSPYQDWAHEEMKRRLVRGRSRRGGQ